MDVTQAETDLERQFELTLIPFYERLYATEGDTRNELEAALENDPTLDLLAGALLLLLLQGIKIGADIANGLVDNPLSSLPTDVAQAQRWADELTAVTGTNSLIATVIDEILAGRKHATDIAALAEAKAVAKAKTVAITEISRAVEWGMDLVYEAVEQEYVEFLPREDACKQCSPLAGVYKREEAPIIPQHPLCRCIKRPAKKPAGA